MHWKEKDIIFLKENYPKRIPLSDLSKKLNKSIRAISHKAAREGLSRKGFRFNLSKEPRKVIEKRYYEKNKDKIYLRKKNRIDSRREKLQNLLGGKCKICGYSKCSRALDFHHNSGKKEGNISQFITDFSIQKSLKEIKKCILLCANCHRELHNQGA